MARSDLHWGQDGHLLLDGLHDLSQWSGAEAAEAFEDDDHLVQGY